MLFIDRTSANGVSAIYTATEVAREFNIFKGRSDEDSVDMECETRTKPSLFLC